MKKKSKSWGVKSTGQNTNQSIALLIKQRNAAKKRGDTKVVRQKNFAIQAKRHWKGGVN